MSDFLVDLNDEQIEAVKYIDSPLLVLSGAGTGKTRVITHKIAYLIKAHNVEPNRILAVTFTNKAAEEMKSRVYSLIGEDALNLWIGTFHSNALRILRRESHLLGLESNFTIIDQDDRLSLVKSILKDLNIDDKKYPAKMYLNVISGYKNSLDYVKGIPPVEKVYRFDDVFDNYQSILRRSLQIDFDDMLSLVLRIFKDNCEILEYYRKLFRYILVDEFQDTNSIQFEFLKLLGDDGNLCAVGDDDQSIYGWRGAVVENIVNFDKHFEHVKIVRLEKNYRSAGKILYLANNLISKNRFRKGKLLRPVKDFEAEIDIKRCFDENDEANYVAEKLKSLINRGIDLSEIAILYRTNAQSRNFEVILNRLKVPYQVIGSVGFYQRKEIKDILSYLRFFNNPFDLNAFVRCVKFPPKGIGDKTIDKIVNFANREGVSFYAALQYSRDFIGGNIFKKIENFLSIFEHIKSIDKISEMIKYVVDATNYEMYVKQFDEVYVADKRMNNIVELVNSAVAFEESNPNAKLHDFLVTTTLQTSSDELDSNSVKLMTIHAAKGLEFDAVFLVGLENGLFPLYSSFDDEMLLEEERRLCYVALTRAKRYLYLSYADSRIIYGRRQDCEPSIFIDEMGIKDATSCNLKDGNKVEHNKFGKGIIVSLKGEGEDAKADVLFEKFGIKKMAVKFLKRIS